MHLMFLFLFITVLPVSAGLRLKQDNMVEIGDVYSLRAENISEQDHLRDVRRMWGTGLIDMGQMIQLYRNEESKSSQLAAQFLELIEKGQRTGEEVEEVLNMLENSPVPQEWIRQVMEMLKNKYFTMAQISQEIDKISHMAFEDKSESIAEEFIICAGPFLKRTH